MPYVRRPVVHTQVRYSTRPGRHYSRPAPRPVPPPAKKRGLLGLLGGLGGLLICLLCLASLGLLGLFATFIPIVKYLGDIYNTFNNLTGGNSTAGFASNMNMLVLLVALCFASIYKLSR